MTAKSEPSPSAEENAPGHREFDAPGLARELLRTILSGALGTIDRETGGPFCSLVTVATDLDGTPILLLSRLSAHTANLDADPRASLLLATSGKGDPLAHPRLTLSGRIERTKEPRLRRRFLARHPKAELYADFPDFGFHRLDIEAGHLNGGFARAAQLRAADILLDLSSSAALLEAEEGAVAHMNEDHGDALRLYATRLAGRPEGKWRTTGCDPEGIDLASGDLTCRVRFPAVVTGPGDLRRTLVELAAAARRRADS